MMRVWTGQNQVGVATQLTLGLADSASNLIAAG